MKPTEITCAGCGKKVPVTTGEGHTGIVKCECGTTTTVQGEPGPVLEEINRMLPKIVGIIKQFKNTGSRGPETGLGEGAHIATRDMVVEVLKEDEELRAALKDYVRSSLEASLFQREKGEGENDGDEDPGDEEPPRR